MARLRLAVAWLLLALASDLTAQPERPVRPPVGGGSLHVTLSIAKAHGHLKPGDSDGEIWFEPTGSKKYRGATTLAPLGADGAAIALPEVAFQLDADLDPLGAEEPLPGPLASGLLLRAATSSDLALIPIRLLLPHKMNYDGTSREATKAVQCVGATVEMREVKLGARRIEGVSHDLYFTRSVRRYQPSGYQIHDYVLTAEDAAEGYVMAGAAMRVLIAPPGAAGATDGPEAGVLLVSRIQCDRLNWLNGRVLVPASEMSGLLEKFGQNLANGLFEAMETEGLGDPFDSPSAVALATTGMLDDKTVARLLNIGHPKSLAMLAPQLVAARVRFDPAVYLKLWRAADDPVRRLLLAAGARAGGADDPAFVREATLAVAGHDRKALRAARLLASALGDQALVAEADRNLRR